MEAVERGNTAQQYTAEDIKVLRGLEGVRQNPAMYVGSTGLRGLHHIAFEVIDNAIDEAVAGYCDKIEVTLNPDGSLTVEDNGRGIPVDIHPDMGRPAVEVVLTHLHAGGKFDRHVYKVSGGLHGVGVSVTNALSEWLVAEVKRDGYLWRQRFERGRPTTELKRVKKVKGTGTRITFKPDPEIFDTTEWDWDILAERLQELAYLNRGVRLKLRDLRPGREKEEVFHKRGGIEEFVKDLNQGKEVLHRRPIYISGERNGVRVEAAIQYNTGYAENITSFANNIRTVEGGTHLSGFRTALTRVINQFARKLGVLKEKDANLLGEDVREGLTAIISVMLPKPQFEGQTKMKLGNTEVEGIVNSIVGEGLSRFFEENPSVARKIAQKALTAARARIAAKKASELVKRKSLLEESSLPGKLADCSERNPERAELFIVEGESAGGTAKTGRDPRYQAVLPLKGKILNVEKHGLSKILSNEEIRALIQAIGTGITDSSGRGEGSFDLSRLRYSRIIIMTDADVDGAHIRTLLLTFFFRYMRPLIERGHVYIALPPLYCVRKGKEYRYAYSDEERDRIIEEFGGKGVTVQRYKGLGEMNPSQLAETTMNPETRTITQVRLVDAKEAERLFSILMGGEVKPRRDFISEHALEVRYLDI